MSGTIEASKRAAPETAIGQEPPEPLLADSEPEAEADGGEGARWYDNGRWLLVAAAVLPWAGLGLMKLFASSAMITLIQKNADEENSRFQ